MASDCLLWPLMASDCLSECPYRQVKMLAGTLPSPKQGQGELGGFLQELGYKPSQVSDDR